MRLKSPIPMQRFRDAAIVPELRIPLPDIDESPVIGWALHRHYSLMTPAKVVANSPSPLDAIRHAANLEG
jgi:hypothetical protein